MTTIDHRVEADSYQQDYSGRVFTADEIAEGEHLRFIGGAWPKHGRRQLDFMITHGLKPEHTLLDIGCGCFRAGRHFVDYLEPGHYYGIDANRSLMQVGYDLELGEEQRARLPVGNLRANDRFDGDFGVQVDFALAQSVFTHVSLNHIRLCLYRTARVVRPGGSFFATFFERGADTPVDRIFAANESKPFFTEKNVYWYYSSDLRWAAQFGRWKAVYIGDWGHPAKQKMMQFIRLPDEEPSQPSRALIARGRRWAARKLEPAR
jgi:SAM-dependent methyltransferase